MSLVLQIVQQPLQDRDLEAVALRPLLVLRRGLLLCKRRRRSTRPPRGAASKRSGEGREIESWEARVRSYLPRAAGLCVKSEGRRERPVEVDVCLQVGDLLLRVPIASAPAIKRRGGGS